MPLLTRCSLISMCSPLWFSAVPTSQAAAAASEQRTQQLLAQREAAVKEAEGWVAEQQARVHAAYATSRPASPDPGAAWRAGAPALASAAASPSRRIGQQVSWLTCTLDTGSNICAQHAVVAGKLYKVSSPRPPSWGQVLRAAVLSISVQPQCVMPSASREAHNTCAWQLHTPTIVQGWSEMWDQEGSLGQDSLGSPTAWQRLGTPRVWSRLASPVKAGPLAWPAQPSSSSLHLVGAFVSWSVPAACHNCSLKHG